MNILRDAIARNYWAVAIATSLVLCSCAMLGNAHNRSNGKGPRVFLSAYLNDGYMGFTERVTISFDSLKEDQTAVVERSFGRFGRTVFDTVNLMAGNQFIGSWMTELKKIQFFKLSQNEFTANDCPTDGVSFSITFCDWADSNSVGLYEPCYPEHLITTIASGLIHLTELSLPRSTH